MSFTASHREIKFRRSVSVLIVLLLWTRVFAHRLCIRFYIAPRTGTFTSLYNIFAVTYAYRPDMCIGRLCSMGDASPLKAQCRLMKCNEDQAAIEYYWWIFKARFKLPSATPCTWMCYRVVRHRFTFLFVHTYKGTPETVLLFKYQRNYGSQENLFNDCYYCFNGSILVIQNENYSKVHK